MKEPETAEREDSMNLTEEMVQIPRSVLEEIQWQNDCYEPYCNTCNAQYSDGHKEDCPIGIALKPKEVVEKVIPQHEIEVEGHKYVTRIGGGLDCLGCFFRTTDGACSAAYYDGGIDSKCCGGSNADMENRIWVKVG